MQLNNVDESILSRELQAGNELAFAEIFNRFQRLLLNEAYYQLRNYQAAEDVVQDIFVNLWDNRKKILIETSIKRYLLNSVKFKCIDKIRRESLDKKYIEHAVRTQAHSTNSVLLENKELGQQIRKAINDIPAPSYRRAFEMLYLEQKSQKTIAHETNTNLQVVKNQISRALKSLRKSLKKD